MGLKAAVIAAAVVISTPAFAAWQTGSFKDRMSDREYKYVTVQANEPDQGIRAILQVSCMNGSPMPMLILDHPMTRGQIGINWRLDNSPQRPSFLHVFSDPNEIPFVGVSPKMFYGKKRFRITIFPTGSKTLFWEFNISDAQKAIDPIKCSSRSAKYAR